MKFFAARGGLTKDDVNDLISLAQNEERGLYDMGILPPLSGEFGRPLFRAREFTPCVECVVVLFIRVKRVGGRGCVYERNEFSTHTPLPPHLHHATAPDNYR